MKHTILDLSILSDQAQKEIIDFYEFLKERKQKKIIHNKLRNLSKLIPRTVKEFKFFTREEIYER